MSAATERDAVRAALLALLDSLPCAALVQVTTPSGVHVASFHLPPLADPPALVVGTDTPCALDLLYVIGEALDPLTTPRVLEALDARSLVHGEDTVKKTLARLVAEGKLVNPKDAGPRGYRLPPRR